MRATCLRVAYVVLLATLLTGFQVSSADEPVSDGSVSDEVRKKRLEIRGREWLETRRKLVYQAGRRSRISRRQFFKLYYELQSPAWRKRQGDPETLEPRLRAMDEGKGRPRTVRSFVVADVELVGGRFGIVRYKMNGIDALRTSRWVWSSEEKNWFLYGGEVDGRWKTPSCDASPGLRRALPDEEKEALSATIGKLALRHTLRSLSAAGTNDVVVVLAGTGAQERAARTAHVQADAIAVLRAVLGSERHRTGIRLAFLADWIDAFGRVSSLPHLHACMDRTSFEKIVFENLDVPKTFALFTVREITHEGQALREP